MMSGNYVQRRFNIDARFDDAIGAMVEEMGGNVKPDYFVNLALEAFVQPRTNGQGAHQVDRLPDPQ